MVDSIVAGLEKREREMSHKEKKWKKIRAKGDWSNNNHETMHRTRNSPFFPWQIGGSRLAGWMDGWIDWDDIHLEKRHQRIKTAREREKEKKGPIFHVK